MPDIFSLDNQMKAIDRGVVMLLQLEGHKVPGLYWALLIPAHSRTTPLIEQSVHLVQNSYLNAQNFSKHLTAITHEKRTLKLTTHQIHKILNLDPFTANENQNMGFFWKMLFG